MFSSPVAPLLHPVGGSLSSTQCFPDAGVTRELPLARPEDYPLRGLQQPVNRAMVSLGVTLRGRPSAKKVPGPECCQPLHVTTHLPRVPQLLSHQTSGQTGILKATGDPDRPRHFEVP